jgi:two-component system LytT family response regulator
VAKVEVVIADDEPLARKKLSLLLEKDPEVCLVEECGTVQQTIEAVNGKKPDLLFLDIQMPDGEGFLALEKIAPGAMPVVIFTTAFDQHAVRAFEANALDYLLKPFDETRFVKSLGRAKAYLAATASAGAISGLMDSLGALANGRVHPERLVFRAEGRMVFVNPCEIDWIEAASNYVRLHVGAGSYLVRSTVGEAEARLDAKRFVRIHRSVIVNGDRIKELKACNSGEFIVTLTNGKQLPASRGFRENIEKLLNRML